MVKLGTGEETLGMQHTVSNQLHLSSEENYECKVKESDLNGNGLCQVDMRKQGGLCRTVLCCKPKECIKHSRPQMSNNSPDRQGIREGPLKGPRGECANACVALT
jgi:hypothetical protein